MSIFEKCKHEWEIIVDEYAKSPLQKMNDSEISFKGDMTGKIVLGRRIIILQCKKCGKLNKTIEKV